MHLETERLWLRNAAAGDIPALVALWTDPEVTRFLGGPRDEATLRERMESDLRDGVQRPLDLWSLVEKSSDKVIGDCGLLPKQVEGKAEVELIYILTRQAWGQGYASEIGAALCDFARRELGLRRLIALIEPEHAASARVAEKVGMSLAQQTTRPSGRIMHVYAMQL